MKLHPKSTEIIRKLIMLCCPKEEHFAFNKIINETIDYIKEIDPIARMNKKEKDNIPNLIKYWKHEGKVNQKSIQK